MPRYASLSSLFLVLVIVGCSERPTGPPAPNVLSPTSTVSTKVERATTADLATVIWEAKAGQLAASRNTSPIVAARAYALLALAQYGAVVAADADGNRDADDEKSRNSRQLGFDVRRGAVAAASAQVLKYAFPLDAAQITVELTSEAGAGTAEAQRQFASGVTIGRSIGDALVQRGVGDGFANADRTPKLWDPASLAAGANIWAMDIDASPHVPAGFQFPSMRPYFLLTAYQFRSPPPPTDLTAGLNDVLDVLSARTLAQENIAKFWNLTNGTVTALGYWDQQAAAYIAEYRLDERAAAHVFALVNAAAMDAVIGCWDAKYKYLVLRPWMVSPVDFPRVKLIIGRPNHPSYPSGHSCVSSASATVLKRFFPEKKATLDQQVAEAGMSRIYAGIHYAFDIEQGQKLGRSVARWAIRYDRKHGLLAAVLPTIRDGDRDDHR